MNVGLLDICKITANHETSTNYRSTKIQIKGSESLWYSNRLVDFVMCRPKYAGALSLIISAMRIEISVGQARYHSTQSRGQTWQSSFASR